MNEKYIEKLIKLAEEVKELSDNPMVQRTFKLDYLLGYILSLKELRSKE